MANNVIKCEGNTYIRRLEKYHYMHDIHFQGLTNPYKDAGMQETAINRLADSD
jgi:hypothetical protein